jgi:hypothetical protein
MADQKDIVSAIVYSIKNDRSSILNLIIKNGGVIKKTDSDVKIGKELSRVIAGNRDAQVELARIIFKNQESVFGIDDAIAGVTNLLSQSAQSKMAAQQGQDAITLALINAGIQKQNQTNWPLIIGISTLVIVVVIIGILLIKKYSKK